MGLDRRGFMAAAAGLLATPALAAAPVPALSDYERACGGRIGVYARNLASGDTLSWRADERFVMCSTFKASLAACVLARVDRGQERLEAVVPYGPGDLLAYAPVAKASVGQGGLSVRELCAGAVELSDNTCANLLLARVGGPPALTAFWRSLGDRTSRLDHDEPLLNRSPPGDPHDTTTPRAMADNLERLVIAKSLSTGSRDQLTRWMLGCRTGDKRLRAGLPKAWRIGDKTGNNGRDAAGDIAVAWPRDDQAVIITAYTQGGRPTEPQLETVFTAIGRAVAARWA